MRGPLAANWRGDLAVTDTRRNLGYRLRLWRRAVLDRDGHRCRLCGATERLHAHHVVEFHISAALRLDVDNGLTLCLDCHSRVHGRRLARTASLVAPSSVGSRPV
jgi:predicted restriction endonuclease